MTSIISIDSIIQCGVSIEAGKSMEASVNTKNALAGLNEISVSENILRTIMAEETKQKE